MRERWVVLPGATLVRHVRHAFDVVDDVVHMGPVAALGG
jgi:hypothetical protein